MTKLRSEITAYIVTEIAIQVCACGLAQSYGARGRDSSPSEWAERATRIMMGGAHDRREWTLRDDSAQTAWRVYAHLKQLGLIDDRSRKT